MAGEACQIIERHATEETTILKLAEKALQAEAESSVSKAGQRETVPV